MFHFQIGLLGSKLVQMNKLKKEIRLRPSESREDLIELSYYGNPLVSFFIMEGIIGTFSILRVLTIVPYLSFSNGICSCIYFQPLQCSPYAARN